MWCLSLLIIEPKFCRNAIDVEDLETQPCRGCCTRQATDEEAATLRAAVFPTAGRIPASLGTVYWRDDCSGDVCGTLHVLLLPRTSCDAVVFLVASGVRNTLQSQWLARGDTAGVLFRFVSEHGEHGARARSGSISGSGTGLGGTVSHANAECV